MFDRKEIMKAAWARFRQVYHFPNIAFKRIGRHCLASCISIAWQEAKVAAKISAITVGQLAEKVSDIKARIERADMSADAGSWSSKRQALDAELSNIRIVAARAGLNLA